MYNVTMYFVCVSFLYPLPYSPPVKLYKSSVIPLPTSVYSQTASMSYQRINDREKLLETMLKLESEIRKQREEKRSVAGARSEKYTKMFEPVTKSIEKLIPKPPPPQNLINLNPQPNLLHVDPQPPNLLDEENPDPNPILEPKREEEDDEEKFFEEPNNELYRQALSLVPQKLRSDGVLGLDTESHTIGSYEYEVKGDMLHCTTEDETDEVEFKIGTLDVWLILLVKNPNRIALKLKKGKEYLPFVYEYKDIVDRLQLVETSKHFSGFNLRRKFKVLEELEHAGSGFLFTVQPPAIKSSTVFIPSDRDGLMRQLYTALAELRAGNTSMQNVVVPLAAEAKRLGCLPQNLLSPDEETWVFA